MRVVIVGAGLAGLACAHELERLGLKADILEQRTRIGKMFRTVETMLQAFNLDPTNEIATHMQEELNLPIHPANPIHTAIIHAPTRTATVTGKLGYTTIRGDHELALEVQLARKIKSPIYYEQWPELRYLLDHYDQVIIACGSPKFTKELGLWTRDMGWWIRGANVKGRFNPNELHFYFDTRYAGTGYAMLAPFDQHTATVGVGVPECPEDELEAYWERFRTDHSHLWESVLEEYKLENFEYGRVPKRIVDKVWLVGNAGGFAEPLGLTGQMSSLSSGVYAARQLVTGEPVFDRFAKRWDKYYRSLWRLRRNVNAWTDADMDRFTFFTGRRTGSFLMRSPFNLMVPAGTLLDYLPMADDSSPEPGHQ